MEKLKTKILLEVIDDIIIEYPDTNDLIQQKLNEKCDREGISIDKVICFFNKSRSKKIFTNQACYISKSTYAISRFKSVICSFKILKGAQFMYIKEDTFKVNNRDLFFA